MAYELEVTPSCRKSIRKLSRKNPLIRKALEKKIGQIRDDPFRFKPLRHELAGERRVHILKSFVLVFTVKGNSVVLLSFSHHDDAYRR